jgi:hypothetical protein
MLGFNLSGVASPVIHKKMTLLARQKYIKGD